MIPYAQSGHSREPLFVLSNEEMEDLTTQTLSETFVVSREDNSQRKKAWQSKVVGCKEENSGEQIASLAPSSLEEPVQQVLVPPKLKKSWNWKSMLLFGNAEEETVALMDEPAQEDLLQVEPQKKKSWSWKSILLLGSRLQEEEETPSREIVIPAPRNLLATAPKILLAMAKSIPPEFGPNKPWYEYMVPKRITIRHVEGVGPVIGHRCQSQYAYGTNYTTVEVLFASLYKKGMFVPMLDLRGHRFDNNTYASNIGFVGRYIPEKNTICEMLGINAFWDYREGHRGHYNQIGIGGEVLGKRWDFRANAYVPVGSKTTQTICLFNDYIGDYFFYQKCEESVCYGFNAEVGYLAVRSKDFLFYVAAGPYYLWRRCNDTTRGGEIRIRPQYKDYAAFDFKVSYDSIFHVVYQWACISTIPLYQIYYGKREVGPCGITNRQVYQPVERFEVMPIREKCHSECNFCD